MIQVIKKITILAGILFVNSINIFCYDFGQGQNTAYYAPAYEPQGPMKHVIFAGVTMGTLDYDPPPAIEDRGTMFMPVSLSYEYRMSELFGFGVSTGYSKIKYVESNQYENEDDYLYSWSYLPLDLRLNFHFVSLINELSTSNIKDNSVDLYASFFVGPEYRIFTALNKEMEDYSEELNESETSTDESEDNKTYKSKIHNNPNFGFMLGISYMPFKHLGFFLEAGKGPVGHFNIGLATEF